MKAITQNATYEFSKAKKVIASVVAAVLVISFGNFAVAGTTQALADDNTVEVRFKVTATDTTVSVGDQTFGADVEGSYAAAVDADLSFTINAGENAPAVAVSYMTEGGTPVAHAEMGSKQPSDNLIIGESSLQDDSNDTSDATDEEEAPEVEEPQESAAADDSTMYIEQEVTPIPETAAILQEENAEDDQVALASTGDTDAAEEVLEDEFPPMAAAPTAADAVDDETDEEEAVESVTVQADENGNYTIPAAALASAAERDAVIVVTVAAEEGITSWDEVAEFLKNGEEGTVKLAADVTEGVEPVEVHGNKTLDLNGCDIKADTVQGSLFLVNEGNSLTITDESEDAAAKELEVTNSEFNGKKIPNPAEKPDVFEKMVGKAATYDAKSKTLTYFVTNSYTNRPAKGQTEEYLFEHRLDLSGAGAIEVANGQLLVDVNGGELNIEGGRFTQTSGRHMIAAQGDATINMTDGFMVGAQGDSGAAINAKNSTVNIGGNAILAGNTATDNSDGGAIFVDDYTTLNIGGKAILAGNQAGEGVLVETNTTGFANVRRGGAVYAEEGSTVVLSGNAILAGNIANADGGAIYINGKGAVKDMASSTLEISDNVLITNNRALNDKGNDHEAGKKSNGGRLGGGGGIFALDAVTINNAQITGNFASDAGGGMVITYVGWGKVAPTLCIENVVVASNWAGTSEGGGIHARTSYTPLNSNPDDDSYINAGYLTNNMTSTTWDYGGGALFLEQATSNTSNPTTGMLVRYPLITGNTANAFGGGVGVCTNGFVVTADAAIYDNTAKQANATTNPGEYGDQWAFDKDTYGLNIENGASDDFFCAKRSEVYNSMLGGGFYRWTGYTSGTITYTEKYAGTISTWRDGDWKNKQTGMTLNDQEVPAPPNALFNPTTKVAEIYIPDGSTSVANFIDYYVTIEVKTPTDDPNYPKGKWSGRVIASNPVVPSGVEGFSKFELTLELTDSSEGFRKKVDFSKLTTQTLKAHTNSESEREYTIYHLEELDTFPQTADAVLQSDRFTALKANPKQGAKDAALAKAVLFVTGNYSNTNGGGIACNDRIAIGRDPGDPDTPEEPGTPNKPADKFGALQITKSLDKFSAANGTATALFKVTGYVDYDMAKNKIPEFVIYENTVGFTFGAGEGMSASEVLTGLPEGYYVIEELYYSGDNFDGTPNRALVEVTGVEAGSESEVPTVEVPFKNKYKDETYGSGVVNRYASGENGFKYTPISPSPISPLTEEGR